MRRPISPTLAGLLALGLLAWPVSADNLCTLVKGQLGACRDNGCHAADKHCHARVQGGLIVACNCRPVGGMRTVVGVNLEFPGGGYHFDGAMLILGSLFVGNTYDFASDTHNNADPIVGSMLIIPELFAAGMKTFDNGEHKFDYYAFENVTGAPIQIMAGPNVVFQAAFDELAYMQDSRTWGILLDLSRQYNNAVGSPALQKMQGIDQSDPSLFPGMVIASLTDAFAQTDGFTTPGTGNLGFSSIGIDRVHWCPADWNADGSINSLDVLAFLNDYTSGNERADINGDGVLNTMDVLTFLNAFNAGCP
ncbi:MAG: hypothetical protein KIS87_06180 [Phycisphaeraceae bacterium]|nr:hypothetical protein [Phycisphaeraceae bacterium]